MPRHSDPLQQLLDLQERVNRLFEQTLGRERLDDPRITQRAWSPAADGFETPAAYVVEIDVPGLHRDDVVVQVDRDQLVVRGEKPPSTAGRAETFHRLERLDGPFLRVFPLPERVEPESVAAELQDGVLRVTVRKTGGARRVRVEHGG